MTIRVASRKSALAMRQTEWVIAELQEIQPGLTFEIIPVTTKGDRILDVTLSKVGGKGLFISEIEEILLRGEADMAVHSMKDMPAALAPGLMLGGVPARVDPRDVLISRTGDTWETLKKGSVIGTSSLRRMAQLKALRPDFVVQSIRGNIDTRLRKMMDGEFDAIILAAAGLVRMGWTDKVTQFLEPEVCLPAVGQGTLGIECRSNDIRVTELLARLTDDNTKAQAVAERSLLEALDGNCQVPLAGYAWSGVGASLHMQGLVASEDGTQVIRAHSSGQDPEALGKEVARKLKELGADEMLTAVSMRNQ